MEQKLWLVKQWKGMLLGCEQPFLWGERYVTSQKTAPKETTHFSTTMSISNQSSAAKSNDIGISLVSLGWLRYFVHFKMTPNTKQNNLWFEDLFISSLVIFTVPLLPLARTLYYLYRSPMYLHFSSWILSDVYLGCLKTIWLFGNYRRVSSEVLRFASRPIFIGKYTF